MPYLAARRHVGAEAADQGKPRHAAAPVRPLPHKLPAAAADDTPIAVHSAAAKRAGAGQAAGGAATVGEAGCVARRPRRRGGALCAFPGNIQAKDGTIKACLEHVQSIGIAEFIVTR